MIFRFVDASKFNCLFMLSNRRIEAPQHTLDQHFAKNDDPNMGAEIQSLNNQHLQHLSHAVMNNVNDAVQI